MTESTSSVNTGPLWPCPDGFPFDKQSTIRQFTEPAAFLLFPYVAGLTVMNDSIAAAVNVHSSFRERPWRRLAGTGNAAVKLVFGDQDEASTTAQRIYDLHTHINGAVEGTRYDANNANLQKWVLADVFSGIAEASRRWSEPLENERREAMYQDVRTFGLAFGLEPELLPENVTELDQYWNAVLDGDQLLQTGISRYMARTVFRFESPNVPKSLTRLAKALAVTSLDPRLQEKADLRPTKSDLKVAKRFDAMMQKTYKNIPISLRQQVIPAYLVASRVLSYGASKLPPAKPAKL